MCVGGGGGGEGGRSDAVHASIKIADIDDITLRKIRNYETLFFRVDSDVRVIKQHRCRLLYLSVCRLSASYFGFFW